MLREIDPARIEANVRKLASFGTRHTLSSQDDPVRGIGAARDWIFAEFAAVRRGVRRADDRRAPVLHPAGRRRPGPRATPRSPTSSRRCAATTTPTGSTSSAGTTTRGSPTSSTPPPTHPAPTTTRPAWRSSLELARVMATRHTEATIVFAAVAGEEQGLYGSTYMAEQLQGRRRRTSQGMFTNDIVGSSTADDGTRDPRSVRLFAEGVPTSRGRRPGVRSGSPVGGENDSPARQLARFVDRGRRTTDAPGMDIRVIYRLRPLPARRRPHLVPEQRLPGGAVHRAGRELRPPAPGRPRRERHPVRRPAGVLRLRLHRRRGPGQRRRAVVARPGARARRAA